ncbi:hypothetical protein QQZ08_000389 [Neonectria magnoliae]|uniref:Uncharacterized protein n=1 Tax=Neonectria magnoliae TaxID=2732573 RepID=A0ABR1IJL2_9HYPO
MSANRHPCQPVPEPFSDDGMGLGSYRSLPSKRIDLLDNYAGNELSLAEFDLLHLYCSSELNIDFGTGFQLLHAVYAIQNLLSDLLVRKCRFHVIGFDHNELLCIPAAAHDDDAPKDRLARAVIMHHFSANSPHNCGFELHRFDSSYSNEFRSIFEYAELRKLPEVIVQPFEAAGLPYPSYAHFQAVERLNEFHEADLVTLLAFQNLLTTSEIFEDNAALMLLHTAALFVLPLGHRYLPIISTPDSYKRTVSAFTQSALSVLSSSAYDLISCYNLGFQHLQSLDKTDELGPEVQLFTVDCLFLIIANGKTSIDQMSIAALIWNSVHCLSMATSGETPKVATTLEGIVKSLGFPGIDFRFNAPSQPLAFSCLDSKTFQNKRIIRLGGPIEFQLEHCGPYLNRAIDSTPESRSGCNSTNFCWENIHLILRHKKVLQADGSGVLAYVAPTTAHVNQITAEIHDHFSKIYNHAGRSVWAMHARDYCINNPTGCQILVTVPLRDVLSTNHGYGGNCDNRRVDAGSVVPMTRPVLVDLHAKGALPCIVFNYDRIMCETLVQSVMDELGEREAAWKASKLSWQKKLADYHQYVAELEIAQARAARAPRKQPKRKKKRDEDDNDDEKLTRADRARELPKLTSVCGLNSTRMRPLTASISPTSPSWPYQN